MLVTLKDHNRAPGPLLPINRNRLISSLKPTHLATAFVSLLGIVLACAGVSEAWSQGDGSRFTLSRENRTITLEPYGSGIVRITLSTNNAEATAPPGYGITGIPSMTGWSHERDSEGWDVIRSGKLVVRIAPQDFPHPGHLPLDPVNQKLRDIYFPPGNRRGGPSNDTITVSTTAGKQLLTMWNWAMYPNRPDDTVGGQPKDKGGLGYRVTATFDSPTDEHYYGLGQQQQGFLDLRDHRIDCWHNYRGIGGENVCVPFMVSSRDYGIVWDNPSKTTIDLGFNQQNVWTSEVGDRVSFFVIAGDKVDDVYRGYRQLTGIAHLLPKAAYGYIQSKAIYSTQEQILDVAKGYRDRNLPLDILVVDFLNMTRQGEMDLDPARWPDPATMNKQLDKMGIKTLLSVWPHYAPGTQFYEMLKERGWLISGADSIPDTRGYAANVIGPNIDTTNPEAAKWWWEKIRDRYIKPYQFSYIWLDETEPDIDPYHDYFFVGSGKRYYNIYPLFHTASVFDGSRRDFGDDRRVMSLARASYLGAQSNGTVFWSSDIVSTWDMLKRSIPSGLNFTASGMPYWDTDIAGFFSPQLPANYHAARKPLVDAPDARENIANYEDYPELFVRWFQWGAFQPVMRAHGERMHNEVWAYGKQAEAVLSKYLRLRYQLMPYTYSLAYGSYETGAPFTRALFMDFPDDPKVASISDEYMFGPAILVAPVTEQGATTRSVYLPAGCDWYNYWTNERIRGGQTVTAAAPIETLPLFVRAGSIIPLGTPVLSTAEKQQIAKIRVYAGGSGDFRLYDDDGSTYAYEKGESRITQLHWDDVRKKFSATGATSPGPNLIELIGDRR